MRFYSFAVIAIPVSLVLGSSVRAQYILLPPKLSGPGGQRVLESRSGPPTNTPSQKNELGSLLPDEDKLTLTNALPYDQFGVAVALNGGTGVVGAWLKDDPTGGLHSGTAYVFGTNSGGGNKWDLLQQLPAQTNSPNENFGVSVALTTDTLVVGACAYTNYSKPGSAYIFNRLLGEGWEQGPRLTWGQPGDQFGVSVAVDGGIVVVGANRANGGAGSAYVFERSGSNTWGPPTNLVYALISSKLHPADEFGISVAVRSNTIAVGAWGADSLGAEDTGAVYMFERDSISQTWRSMPNIVPTNALNGHWFGRSVALGTDTLLVGARGGLNGTNSGSVYVYHRYSVTNWQYIETLSPTNGQPYDEFGVSMALDGNTAIIGAIGDSGTKGAAYLFNSSNGTNWAQLPTKLAASTGMALDLFGVSVALSGQRALVGAGWDEQRGKKSGAAYFYFSGSPPVASNYTFALLEDSTLTGDVLTNDFDPDGYPLTATLVNGPAHAASFSWTFSTNGEFTYVPATNYNGTDSFTYYVTNIFGSSSVATVTLVVTPVNDPPVATNYTFILPEDSTFTGNVLTNAFDPDGDSLTAVTNGIGPSNAFSFAFGTNGVFSYTPLPNYNGTDFFQYYVSDGITNSSTAMVTLIVTPVNDPPVATNYTFILPEGSTFTGNVLTNAFDPDGDSLTAVTNGIGPSNAFSFAFGTNGIFSYTPLPNYSGTDFFQYYVSDGITNSSTAMVTLIVKQVIGPPSFIAGPNIATVRTFVSRTVSNWAESISPGPGGTTQGLNFVILANSKTDLFAFQSINVANGDLTFTPTNFGFALIRLALRNSAATNAGDMNTSVPQTFTITVIDTNKPIPDPPLLSITQSGTNARILGTLGMPTTLIAANSLPSFGSWIPIPAPPDQILDIPFTNPAQFFRLRVP